MILALFIYAGMISLFIIGTIHHYEAKVQNLKEAISDYQRAIKLSKTYSNAEHYTHLQLDNKALQQSIRSLKDEIASLRNAQPIQYESSKWTGNTETTGPVGHIPQYKETELFTEL
jgi:hypothetical protein